MDPITPPLMPRDLTSTPFIPSSPCMRMEILSEPETPVLPGREELEAALLAGTNISSDEASDSDGDGIPKGNVMDKFIKVQGTTKLPASGLITHKKRPLGECMKVDAPLTPPVSTKKRCVNAKVNSLAEILESNPLPSVVPLVENAPFNLENLLPTSISAKQQIEQQIQRERIRGADAGVCAEIPQLPDSFPKPPWPNTSTGSFCQGCPVEYSRTSVAQLSRDHCFFIQTGISEGHEQNLRWNPFPQGLPKVETEELIGNDTAISEILAESKRPSDEYKLLERPRPARDDLGSTDSDLPGDVTVYKEESSRLLDIPLTQQEEKHAPSTKEKRIPLLTQVPETLDGQPFFNDPRSSLLSSQFSAFRNLSTFMRMRGSKCQNQNSSNQHSSELLETSEATHNSKIRVGILEDVVTGTEATIPGFGPPAGGTPQTTFPLTFILSTSLLRSYRCVIQSLEGLSTPRFLVFRDYSAMAFQLNEQQGDDADIVISPTTGILLTTSQETTQLYLPGQSRSCFQLKKKLRSPLWERISHVCSRYDQLYVLIIHPFQVKGGLKTSLDENVLNSIRELMSFCSSIYDTCNVMPLVLDLKCLPQWIVTLARRHAVRISWSDNYSNTGDVAEVSCSAVPCEDPDVWEYFLYQAGLNCFAARMVLSSPVVSASGQPDSQGGTLSPRDAFSNFMSLQSRHRARVYGPLIGEKLASRIGILLDAEW